MLALYSMTDDGATNLAQLHKCWHAFIEAMITRNTEEAQRPLEWLLRFEEDARRYRALLEDSGSLAVAAYRLARARCRVQPTPSKVPTPMELWAAAQSIAAQVGVADELTTKFRLVTECEHLGLPCTGRRTAA